MKSAVQQESGQVGQLSTEAAAEEKKKKKLVDSGELVYEDTGPEKEINDSKKWILLMRSRCKTETQFFNQLFIVKRKVITLLYSTESQS